MEWLFPVSCTCVLNDWTAERARSHEKNTRELFRAPVLLPRVIDRSSPAFVPGSRNPLRFSLPPTRTRSLSEWPDFERLCPSFSSGNQRSARVRADLSNAQHVRRNEPKYFPDWRRKWVPSEYLLIEDEVLFRLHNCAVAPKLSVEQKSERSV